MKKKSCNACWIQLVQLNHVQKQSVFYRAWLKSKSFKLTPFFFHAKILWAHVTHEHKHPRYPPHTRTHVTHVTYANHATHDTGTERHDNLYNIVEFSHLANKKNHVFFFQSSDVWRNSNTLRILNNKKASLYTYISTRIIRENSHASLCSLYIKRLSIHANWKKNPPTLET